jgi:transcription antitermination protein NusB
MGLRRQAREAALQMLYLCDICDFAVSEILGYYCKKMDMSPLSIEFAEKLFSGASENKEEIDKLIVSYAQNWELNRMATIDRNILRLAAFELMKMPDTPINVIIDEAVEIAKKYSTNDSSKFVNGILDKIKIIRKST